MATDGAGKWHRRTLVTGVAKCGAPVILGTGEVIVVDPGTPASRVHPIVCRRCLATVTTSPKGA